VLFGTFFMAFHSAQGPQLGLPQMIQSRPQFGYIGALLVWLFAYLQYAGFNVFNTILAGQAGHTTIHLSEKLGIVVATVAAVVIALIRYQISWAIYVSDYSRYLPPDVTVRRTFWWTYWGSGLGAVWLMGLGALLASAAGNSFDPVASIDKAADAIFGGFGTIVLLFAALGLISVTALNLYRGSLTLIGAIDSFKRIRPTLGVRVTTIAFTAAISLVVALISSESFLTNFENFLLLILHLFIPWTAVNLVDSYVVRRGHYAVARSSTRPGSTAAGLARDRGLPRRLRRDGPVLLHALVHRPGGQGDERRGPVAVGRAADRRRPVPPVRALDRRRRRGAPGRA
jgi:NCS1 family nucleobase:cation symporter-1